MLKCIGGAAREARRKAGKRPVEVAYLLKRDTATVQRFERGQSWPRNFDAFLNGYAEAIGLDPRELWVAAFDAYLSNEGEC